MSPMKTKTKPLSEYHIAKTCSDWLALDNWRRLNTNPVSDRSRGKGFGELGMADDLYIRYTFLRNVGGSTTEARSLAQMLWIEWKRPGQTAKAHQKAWHTAERARGALVWVAEDTWVTPKDGDPIAAFQAHYRGSGLMRKNSDAKAFGERPVRAGLQENLQVANKRGKSSCKSMS